MTKRGFDPTSKVLRQLRFAYSNSKLYKMKYDAAGFDPKSVHSLEDFSKAPILTREEVEDEAIRTGDPFARLRCSKSQTGIQLQVESFDVPIFTYLTIDDLLFLADSLCDCWRMLNIKKGDKVLICEYGSSPASFLISKFFVPGLLKGAAESIGFIPICNDGIPELMSRGIFIIDKLKPKAVLIRMDLLPIFMSDLNRMGIKLQDRDVKTLLVTADDGFLSCYERERFERILGVRLCFLLRSDVASFISLYDEELHFPEDSYFIEVVDPESKERLEYGEKGRLVLTNLRSRGCVAIRYMTSLMAKRVDERCECRFSHQRVKVEASERA